MLSSNLFSYFSAASSTESYFPTFWVIVKYASTQSYDAILWRVCTLTRLNWPLTSKIVILMDSQRKKAV
jgi:hypothetical protein